MLSVARLASFARLAWSKRRSRSGACVSWSEGRSQASLGDARKRRRSQAPLGEPAASRGRRSLASHPLGVAQRCPPGLVWEALSGSRASGLGAVLQAGDAGMGAGDVLHIKVRAWKRPCKRHWHCMGISRTKMRTRYVPQGVNK